MKILAFVTAGATAFTLSVSAQTATNTSTTTLTAPHHTQVAQSSAATASRNGLSLANQAAAKSGTMGASATQATNLQAELTKKIDSGHSKVGQEVMAKTTSAATLADGTRLPKGTRLLGHVTAVSRETRENKTSSLAFAFDEAVLRGGREVPIHAVLRSLTAPRPLTANAASGFGSQMGAGPMQGGMAGGGMMQGGGGMMGGMAHGPVVRGGGLLNAGGNVAGESMGNLAATTHAAGAASTGMLHAAPEGQSRMLGAASTAALSGGAGASMIPVGNMSGVIFDGSGSANSSAVLEGRGKNISLESGSQMTLAVSASH